MLTGENGILTQAQNAQSKTEEAQLEEENILNSYESFLNSYSGENTEFTDSLGNKVIVPAGFKVVNPKDNVEDGIVIEDVVNSATKGSQFVWIPVGEIQTSSGNKEISLGRYTFDNATGEEITYDEIKHTEDIVSEHIYDNVPAKNIEEFKISTTSNGGYYLGRYEARTNIERKNKEDKLTRVTVKQAEFVYNYVTQVQAATLSRNMYNNSNFTSDLVNSYAWDTAIVFLQECDNREDKTIPYSLQTSLNIDFASKGTNILETKDEICNIYDMASNCYEWTTETYSREGIHCVGRGGCCNVSESNTAARSNGSTSYSYSDIAFRPILYL